MCLLCCKDVRPFDIVSGAGFLDYSQTLLKIGAAYGNLNVKDLLPHSTTISRNIKKEADILRKTLISKVQPLIETRQCSASTDMWTDEYKHLSYTIMTLHFINENWELESKVLFTSEFPDDKKTAFNIKRELNHKMRELGLNGDVLSKITFVT